MKENQKSHHCISTARLLFIVNRSQYYSKHCVGYFFSDLYANILGFNKPFAWANKHGYYDKKWRLTVVSLVVWYGLSNSNINCKSLEHKQDHLHNIYHILYYRVQNCSKMKVFFFKTPLKIILKFTNFQFLLYSCFITCSLRNKSTSVFLVQSRVSTTWPKLGGVV